MLIRCLCCGAEMSLDAVVEHDAAATALNLALSMTPLGKLLVRYIGLFRPAKSKLSWPRVATLLGEVLPMVSAGAIERDGQTHHASHEVWCVALEKVLNARDSGTLKTPLKSHGYVLEIIATESTRGHSQTQARGISTQVNNTSTTASKPMSGTAQAVYALESRKRKG